MYRRRPDENKEANREIHQRRKAVETFLSGMRNIYHHSHTVHFFYHLFTECAYAQSFLIITGRAADIIIDEYHLSGSVQLYAPPAGNEEV